MPEMTYFLYQAYLNFLPSFLIRFIFFVFSEQCDMPADCHPGQARDGRLAPADGTAHGKPRRIHGRKDKGGTPPFFGVRSFSA